MSTPSGTFSPPRTTAIGPTPWHRGIAPSGPGAAFGARLAAAFTSDGRAPLVMLMLLAAVLRLHGAGDDAFWKNELFSMAWSAQPLGFLLGEGLFTETNPPLYFVILKAWTALFGTSEFAARAPSVLISIACIPLIAQLGRDLLSAKAGLIAAALLAVTPVQIYFAHEARAYALLPLFALVALLGAARAMRGAGQDGSPIGAWLLYAGGCIGLVHSHATGIFAVAALGMVMLLAFATGPTAARDIRRLIAANFAVAVLSLPVLIAMLVQSGSANIGWMPGPGLDTPVILNRFLLIGPMVRSDLGAEGSRMELLIEMGLASVAALTLILLTARAVPGPGNPARALLLFLPLLFVGLLVAVSLACPVLIPRVTIWLSVPICLAVAAILAGRLAWPARACAGVLMGCCLAIGLWNNVLAPAQHKPDWRALLAAHPAGIADAPILIAGPHAGPLGIAHYTDGPIRRRLLHWTTTPERPATTADLLERRISGAGAVATAELAALIAGGTPVVLYLDDDDEILIDGHLVHAPWFAAAHRTTHPGLLVFAWNTSE